MSAQSLLDWALQTGLAITLLVGFILIIRRPFAQYFGPKAAYALWMLPVCRLFIPSFDLPVLRPNLPEVIPAITYRGVDLLPIVKNAAVPMATLADVNAALTAPAINLALGVVLVWTFGALCWLAWQFYAQHRYAAHIRAQSSPVNRGFYRSAASAVGLKRMPNIRLAQDNSGPLVMGLLSPVIILPANFETHFTRQQQDLTLMHEMAHIRRLDLWAAMAALVFRAINWPNPVIHYAARAFRADQESACDASVLAASQTPTAVYAETLIQAARSAARPAFSAPLGLTIYHPLKERLMTMKSQNRRSSLLSRVAAIAIVAGAFAFTAPVTLAKAQSDTELAGKPETTTTSKTTSKQVIKSIEDVDGVKVKKHYEITIKDGVTTAYSIDAAGMRTSVDPASIKTKHPVPTPPHPPQPGTRDVQVTVLDAGDGPQVTKRVQIITDGKMTITEDIKGLEGLDELDGLENLEMLQVLDMEGASGENARVFIKRLKEGEAGEGVEGMEVYSFSTSDDIQIHMDDEIGKGYHAKAMVEAASDLMDGVETDALSDKTRRKVEKARKALQDAQDAIDAEK